MKNVEMLIITPSRAFIMCPNCYNIHSHGINEGMRVSHCSYPFESINYILVKTVRTVVLNKDFNYKSDKQVIKKFTNYRWCKDD